ncbi:uncharacterized protein LOC144348097 [Saccoglossus kowalevskii]
MKINTTNSTPVTLGGGDVKKTKFVVYLRSVVDQQGGMDKNVTAWIGKARAAFIMLRNVWASSVIRTTTIFSNVKSEIWRTTKATQHTNINTCLRRIFKIKWSEKISNLVLWARAEKEPVESQITKRKWPWIGHTLRKPPTSITQQP